MRWAIDEVDAGYGDEVGKVYLRFTLATDLTGQASTGLSTVSFP